MARSVNEYHLKLSLYVSKERIFSTSDSKQAEASHCYWIKTAPLWCVIMGVLLLTTMFSLEIAFKRNLKFNSPSFSGILSGWCHRNESYNRRYKLVSSSPSSHMISKDLVHVHCGIKEVCSDWSHMSLMKKESSQVYHITSLFISLEIRKLLLRTGNTLHKWEE